MPEDIKFNLDIEGVLKKVEFETAKALREFLQKVANDAKKECPVRGAYRSNWSAEEMHKFSPGITGGTLRDSITYDFKEKTLDGRVYTQTGYGGYVELGTRKMTARPFLKPAFESRLRKIAEDFENKI